MRLIVSALLLSLCFSPLPGEAAPQNSQTPLPTAGVLTNKDILDMLGAGLTADVVIAKTKSSKCNFDTSPNALKALKAANVPDTIILAMVQAPAESEAGSSTTRPLKSAVITCMNAKEIPAFPTPEVSTAATNARCGSRVSVLDSQGTWVKIQTEEGKMGWVSQYFVSSESTRVSTASEKSATVTAPSQTSNLAPDVLRAVAWRAIPWATTSYWQQQGSADTTCTGSGNWFGDTWHGNASCNTRYTPAQSIPITWQHFTIYNLVETNSSWMVLGCTRNWRWSKCSYLIPGNTFSFEDKKGKISVMGHRAGKDKEQSLDLDVVSIQPKSA